MSICLVQLQITPLLLMRVRQRNQGRGPVGVIFMRPQMLSTANTITPARTPSAPTWQSSMMGSSGVVH
jgi:hypothetical protein